MSSTGNQLRQRVHTGYKSGKDDLRKDAETELKRFIETNGHFSLVRYVVSCADAATFTSPTRSR